MAKRQSRRTASMSRSNYEAAKKAAEERGMTLAGLVEVALAAVDVPVTSHSQQAVAKVQAARKAERVSARRNDTKPRRPPASRRSPSRERQLLGDGVANALDFD